MKKRLIFILIISLIIIIISGLFLIRSCIKKNLKIKLNGNDNIIIKYGEEYQDEGVTCTYKNENLNDKVKIDSNLDIKKIGTYTINYEINYKTVSKKVKRNIKVIDDEKPVIKLNSFDELVLAQGRKYEELGAVASDNYDGDLTDKIIIDTSKLDTNQIGDYEVIYSVSDSSNNESKIIRKVKVVEKADSNQKIAVLNYHFFYENWDEGCHENLCEKMDRFREQLNYLRDNGYYTLTMDEFTKWMYGEIDIPKKSVLITVDDGAYGTSKVNGNHLIPALEQYKMHATLFLVTGWWDIKDYQSDYLDVQSHTNDLHYEASCGHRSKVNCVSYDDLLTDLKKSIEVVQNTNSFCFPFYDSTESSVKAVKEAGFKIAFVGGFRKASRDDDKYRIPRYPIYDSTSLSKFIDYVN